MKIGNIVWQDCNGLLRVGIIKETKKCSDGWTYLNVDWVEDDMYEYWRKPKDRKEFYRWDEVRPINIDKLQKIVSSIESLWRKEK
jgi:hypothetical protein